MKDTLKKDDVDKLKEHWAYSNDDYVIMKTILNVDKITISNLETIRNKIVPNCNYPKKIKGMVPDGQGYCMNCNLDL